MELNYRQKVDASIEKALASPAVEDDGLITMKMDWLDWKFVIESLDFRARKSTGDTAERATFIGDSMQDVLGSL